MEIRIRRVMLLSVFGCCLLLGGLTTSAFGQLVIIDQATGADITATYLPEPGQTVELEGGSSFVLTATTNYPGICTNFGDNSDVGPDFTLSGNQLTANDCGGIVTIEVDGVPVTVPADGNGNEIADILEAPFGGNLTPDEDLELSPSVDDPSNNPDLSDPERRGEGLSIFDELRGFIVSLASPQEGVPLAGFPDLKHIRTDPINGKDYFVHVVNAQCAPPTAPLGTFERYFPAGGQDMFQGAKTLIPGSHIHLLDYTPGAINPTQSTLWEEFFVSFDGFVQYTTGVVEPPTDRQINKNAVFPITDSVTGSTIQKGIRVIECQVDDSVSVLGLADYGTPNRAESIFSIKAGNSIVYPERIRKKIAEDILNAGARKLKLRVYDPEQNKWIKAPSSVAPTPIPKNQSGEDLLTTIHLLFTVAHEIAHNTKLRPTLDLGGHSPSGSGTIMDQTVSVTYSRKLTGAAKFHIPDIFLTHDSQEVKMKN